MIGRSPTSAPDATTWKMLSVANNGDGSFTTLSEFAWLDSGGSPISNSGATNTSSTPQSGSANDLFDGNDGTWCQVNSLFNVTIPQTVFPVSHQVRGVKMTILAGFPARAPKDFEIYYDNGGGLTLIYSSTGNTSWSDHTPQTFMFP